MNTLVVPTIRKDSISRFLEAWQHEFDNILVIEDNPEKTFEIDPKFGHYSWREIEEELGEKAWIISKRDSAIRSFGFWKAYQTGADYIFTLDDDCYPTVGRFCQQHIDVLEKTPQWTYSVPNMRTRGLPYKNLGTLKNVMLNMGLWEGVPDLDGVQSLMQPIENFVPPLGNRIIPRGQYMPLCGMNVAFRREIAVLTYFPLMGLNSPYGRFDDIWAGVILKKVCDHLDYQIACGEPFVLHERASNTFKNLIKEAPGIEVNETFWSRIEGIQLTTKDINGCVCQIGTNLAFNNDQYLSKLGTALITWASLFT